MIPWPIADLLPHAGDMILLDEVLAFDDDRVQTRLRVRPGLLSDADGGLPAWAGVELMAQSVAAYAGCHARRAGEPVDLGFLLGTRRFTCNVERFPVGCDLRIEATRSLQDDSGMGVFECRLEGPGILAEARLNVYRPPQSSRFIEEPAP